MVDGDADVVVGGRMMLPIADMRARRQANPRANFEGGRSGEVLNNAFGSTSRVSEVISARIRTRRAAQGV